MQWLPKRPAPHHRNSPPLYARAHGLTDAEINAGLEAWRAEPRA